MAHYWAWLAGWDLEAAKDARVEIHHWQADTDLAAMKLADQVFIAEGRETPIQLWSGDEQQPLEFISEQGIVGNDHIFDDELDCDTDADGLAERVVLTDADDNEDISDDMEEVILRRGERFTAEMRLVDVDEVMLTKPGDPEEGFGSHSE